MDKADKSKELLLKETNERLRLALQSAHMGTWEWDIQENKVEWSTGTLKIFGTNKRDFKGTYEAYLDYASPEMRNEVNEGVKHFLNNSDELETIQYDHEIIRGDGKRGWIEVRGTLFLDKNKQPLRMVGICSDITEQKIAEDKLRKSEERFALAVKGSNDAIWDWENLESDEYWWSDRLYEILGYKPGEVEARISNWKKWMHSDDSKKVIKSLKDHFEKNKPYKAEFRMKNKNGDYIWLFARGESVRDKLGKPIRMAGSVSDITDRKKVEKALSKAANEWQKTFNSTNDAIWILDKNQKIIQSNKIAENLFNVEREKLIGKHCWEIVHGTIEPIPECPLLKARKSLRRESMEYNIGDKWFLVKVDPLLDSENKYNGVVHSISDITEQKNAVDKIRESEYLLRESQKVAKLGSYVLDIGSGTWKNSETLDNIFGIDKDFERNVEGWIKLVHPDDQNMMLDYLTDHVIANKNPFNQQYRVIRYDNKEERWVHGLGELEFDSEGNPIKMIGTIQDIDERKKAEDELFKYRQHLEEMVQSRTRELEEKNKELEEFNTLFVGREFRIKELKDKIKELEEKYKE